MWVKEVLIFTFWSPEEGSISFFFFFFKFQIHHDRIHILQNDGEVFGAAPWFSFICSIPQQEAEAGEGVGVRVFPTLCKISPQIPLFLILALSSPSCPLTKVCLSPEAFISSPFGNGGPFSSHFLSLGNLLGRFREVLTILILAISADR